VAQPKPPRNEGGEDALLAAIAELLVASQGAAPSGELWSGDDAAVLVAPRGPGGLVTVDALVEGVHVDLSLCTPEDLGWKALSTAVSDIGAMGGRPGRAVAALGGPPGTPVERIVAGMAQAAAAWRCPLVGGDLTGAPVVVVSTTVLGSLGEGPPAVTRAGAKPGDQLFSTGPLGASAAGLRTLRAQALGARGGDCPTWVPADPQGAALVAAHRRPRARLEEGWVARQAGAGAMLDCSDGLSIDLHRLARASGVGLAIANVPVAAGATEAEALGGGEDYELLIATGAPDALLAAFGAAGLREPLRIGECTADPTERRLDDGILPLVGWQHALGGAGREP
jgi:thiamine-monophosphate kinase